jgi:hypothetical protein
MQQLTIGVSCDGGEQVALGGIAWYTVTLYWRIGKFAVANKTRPK